MHLYAVSLMLLCLDICHDYMNYRWMWRAKQELLSGLQCSVFCSMFGSLFGMWEFFLVLARNNVIVSNSCRVHMKPEPVNSVCSTVTWQLYIIQWHVKQKGKTRQDRMRIRYSNRLVVSLTCTWWSFRNIVPRSHDGTYLPIFRVRQVSIMN